MAPSKTNGPRVKKAAAAAKKPAPTKAVVVPTGKAAPKPQKTPKPKASPVAEVAPPVAEVAPEKTILFSDRAKDLDLCPECATERLAKKLGLTRQGKDLQNPFKYWWCDRCNNPVQVGHGKPTLLHALLKIKQQLNGKDLQEVHDVLKDAWKTRPPWVQSREILQEELVRGDFSAESADRICVALYGPARAGKKASGKKSVVKIK